MLQLSSPLFCWVCSSGCGILIEFLLAKYEFKRFRSKSALVAEQLGPSQSLSSRSADLPKRSQTAPIRSEPPSSSQAAPAAFQPPLPLPNQTQPTPAAGVSAPTFQGRSVSSQYPVTRPPRSSSFNPFPTSNAQISNVPGNPAPPANHAASLTSGTFNDLISIQTPASDSSLPLQYQQTLSPMTMSSMNPFPIQPQATSLSANPGNPYANLSTSSALPSSFPNGFGNIRSASLPIPGYSETNQGMQPLSPMPGMSMGGLNVMSTSPFQASPSTSFNMSGSPNPFNQIQQAQVSQQQTPFAPSVSPSIPMFQPSAPTAQSLTPGGFGQTSALFGAGPGPGMYQPPANVNLGQSSPYATQIQQAQQLFQGMAPGAAGGNANPFRSQWQ